MRINTCTYAIGFSRFRVGGNPTSFDHVRTIPGVVVRPAYESLVRSRAVLRTIQVDNYPRRAVPSVRAGAGSCDGSNLIIRDLDRSILLQPMLISCFFFPVTISK